MNLIFNEIEHKYSDSETGIIYPSVTQVIGGALNNKPKFANNDAANKGTIVHKMLELLDKGILDEYDQRLEGYIKGWEQFKKDYKANCILIEKPMVNEIYGFAGTIDRVCEINNERVVIDLKSGGFYKHYNLQVAAYKFLYNKESPVKASKAMCVLLKDSGEYSVQQNNGDSDEDVFLAMLKIYKWSKI